MTRSLRTLWIPISIAVSSCSPGQGASTTADSLGPGERTGAGASEPGPSGSALGNAAGVVDSALPMEELLRRFRAGLPVVTRLDGGATTRDALVRRFVLAVTARDTVTLGELVVSRPEYAFIYFPNSHLARRPYELDPGYAWFHVRSESESGIRRALAAFGGERLAYVDHRCTSDPLSNGPVKIWKGCVLRWRKPDGTVAEGSVFASIIEYQGRFKFFSYGGKL